MKTLKEYLGFDYGSSGTIMLTWEIEVETSKILCDMVAEFDARQSRDKANFDLSFLEKIKKREKNEGEVIPDTAWESYFTDSTTGQSKCYSITDKEFEEYRAFENAQIEYRNILLKKIFKKVIANS